MGKRRSPKARTTPTSVSFTPEQHEWMEEMVRQERYPSVSALVRQAIVVFQKHEQLKDALLIPHIASQVQQLYDEYRAGVARRQRDLAKFGTAEFKASAEGDTRPPRRGN